jgi:hypothetical protein
MTRTSVIAARRTSVSLPLMSRAHMLFTRGVVNLRRAGIALALTGAVLTSISVPSIATAEIITETGCIEYQNNVCVVTQICSLNTQGHTWKCVSLDARDGQVLVQEGRY